jgi:hypothetical protein
LNAPAPTTITLPFARRWPVPTDKPHGEMGRRLGVTLNI